MNYMNSLSDATLAPDPPEGETVKYAKVDNLVDALCMLAENVKHYYPGADYDESIVSVFVETHLTDQEDNEHNNRVAAKMGFRDYDDFRSWILVSWHYFSIDDIAHIARQFKSDAEWISELPDIEEV